MAKKQKMNYQNTIEFARQLDAQDLLNLFHCAAE